MSILIKTVRIKGFRGLENIEVDLEQVTVLTGMNNSGKTSFLKAIQIALGNSQFITNDDLYISNNHSLNKIIVDICIKPIYKNGEIHDKFSESWESLFTENKIRINYEDKAIVPLRTIITYDETKATYKSKRYILNNWPDFKNENQEHWYEIENDGDDVFFNYDEMPFFYINAQRDILEDIKLKNSHLGKIISKIKYTNEDIKIIEQQIEELNKQAVEGSPILSKLISTLNELNSTMDSSKGEGVELALFTKKVRDFSKGLSINYGDQGDSFPMEYHGMGTRSWSSLLTLKAFINLLNENAESKSASFFPILAIEEPESHLHPNAQKKLYSQINSIEGQKIISTHSPYIVASCELYQLRNFYKNDNSVGCGAINTKELNDEEIRKIERQVINTRGELFFSKVIVLSEGETEEQALPIFAKEHFNRNPIELGINFVGVGGHGTYLPFLRVAENLKIPLFIFSDAEKDTKNSVIKQFKDSGYSKKEDEVIIFLTEGNNFEKELLNDGFAEEMKKAITKVEIPKCSNTKHEQAKQKEIANYDNQRILEKIKGNKTKFAPILAETIIESQKELPAKIIDLFEKIETTLRRNDTNE